MSTSRSMARAQASRRVKTAFKKGVASERKRRGHIMNTKLTSLTTITTDAGGNYTDIYNAHNPNFTVNGATAYADWSSFASLYDQYRMRAIKVEFFPRVPNDASGSTNYQPIWIYYDKDSTTALTSQAQAVALDGVVGKNLNRPYKIYRKLRKNVKDQVAPGGWQDCANPVTLGALKNYVTGATSSRNYGVVKLTAYVQFKNRI